jgi:hypothetical protein
MRTNTGVIWFHMSWDFQIGMMQQKEWINLIDLVGR